MLALASRAAAQPVPLSVSHASGTDDCPDAPALLARIERIRGLPLRPGQPAYHVAFTRNPDGLHAVITSQESPGERLLDDAASQCAALAQATAVSLALLFDADARARDAAPVAAVTPATEVREPALADEEAEPRTARTAGASPSAAVDSHALGSNVLGSVAIGGGALLGVTRPITAALGLELGLDADRFGLRVGAHYALPLAVDFASGRVREALIAGSLEGCFAAWSSAAWRLESCAGGVLGALRAEAHGYAEDRRRTRLWTALALDVRIGLVPHPLGASTVLALLLPLRRQDFAIDGAGVAYASAPVGVLLAVRGSFGGAL